MCFYSSIHVPLIPFHCIGSCKQLSLSRWYTSLWTALYTAAGRTACQACNGSSFPPVLSAMLKLHLGSSKSHFQPLGILPAAFSFYSPLCSINNCCILKVSLDETWMSTWATWAPWCDRWKTSIKQQSGLICYGKKVQNTVVWRSNEMKTLF